MEACVAAIGTFDGMHLGHRSVIEKVKRLAEEQGVLSRVITFSNHPLSVVCPEKAPLWAYPRKNSIDFLKCHLDRVSEMNFTNELASLSAADFFKLICERYNVRTLVMGYDNSFGSDRLSTREEYVEAGRRAGVDVVFVEELLSVKGSHMSSSVLRKAIAEWDYPLITELVEESPLYEAEVVRGNRLGHEIGFPTMNLRMPENTVLMPDGVYLAVAYLDQDSIGNGAVSVLSVGTNPTVGDGNRRTFELHVIGKKLGDMYGERISFIVCEKIRDIRKFNSLAELRKAIANDIKIAKRLYEE